jgi:aminopeptidase N
MDEGFTSFAAQETMDYLFRSAMPAGHISAYNSYYDIVRDGREEALDTHADHYITNYAYGTAAYSKGEVYLSQLEYIVGTFHFRSGLLKYFSEWKFKHPDAYDFIRVMEKESGMELDWYNEYFVNSTKTIDYSLANITGETKSTKVILERKGLMPMPVDLEVKYKDGTYENFVLALDIMRGEKPADGYNGKWTVLTDWNWVDPTYTIDIPRPVSEIESITIDPSELMADIDQKNNSIVFSEVIQFILDNQ